MIPNGQGMGVAYDTTLIESELMGRNRLYSASALDLVRLLFLTKEQTMSKAIVRFLAILGALWLIGMVIVMVAVIGVERQSSIQDNSRSQFRADVSGGRSRTLRRRS